MRLVSYRVREFQSVIDSGAIPVDDITCMVGKNEAGKTSVLKALYRLNPIRQADGEFSIVDDYPRMDAVDYEADVAAGKRAHTTVISAEFALEDAEVEAVEDVLGPGFLKTRTLTLSKTYANKRVFKLQTDDGAAVKHLCRNLGRELKQRALKAQSAAELLTIVEPAVGSDPAAAPLAELLRKMAAQPFSSHAYNEILQPYLPKFLYFDEYYQMRGCENIERLQQRVASKTLEPPDEPMLGLIELAGLRLEQLINPSRTQELKNRLEAAGNKLTQRILDYWSQNKHLQMRFDVRPAAPQDPSEMRSGTNIWGEVYDQRHCVSTSLGTRSRGFVWFFSFIAWHSQVQRSGERVILLLDEPGLTLHARAQADLLRFFEEELKPNHQVLYSTHSPFMVDAAHFERVRIVQDRSIESNGDLPRGEQGSKVLSDVFAASDDSLWPLQGALGYDLHQTLFVGPCTLVVEGAADLLYLQAMSALLEREGRTALDDRWTITPAGGSSKVPTFVALLGAQKGLTIATLLDMQASDAQRIEDLYKQKLLAKKNVVTFAEFTGGGEADIEDMLGVELFVTVVNSEYAKDLIAPLGAASLPPGKRVLTRVEKQLEAQPLRQGKFSHYRPARYFAEYAERLRPSMAPEMLDRFDALFTRLNGLLPLRR